MCPSLCQKLSGGAGGRLSAKSSGCSCLRTRVQSKAPKPDGSQPPYLQLQGIHSPMQEALLNHSTYISICITYISINLNLKKKRQWPSLYRNPTSDCHKPRFIYCWGRLVVERQFAPGSNLASPKTMFFKEIKPTKLPEMHCIQNWSLLNTKPFIITTFIPLPCVGPNLALHLFPAWAPLSAVCPKSTDIHQDLSRYPMHFK